MTVTEFESYLEKGLGRAILLLRKEPDKAPFREAAFAYLISKEQKNSFAGDSTAYNLDLIACFDDRDVLKKEVVDSICRDIEEGDFNSNDSFLLAIGCEEAYRASYQKRYLTFFNKTVSHMESRTRSHEAAIDRQRFLNAVITPIRDGQLGLEEMRTVLCDLIKLYELEEETGYHVIDNVRIRMTMEKHFGKDKSSTMIHEVADAHPAGDLLISRMSFRYAETPPPNPAITAEEILACPYKDEEYIHSAHVHHLHISFSVASSAVVQKVAEALLAENDLERRIWLLHFFYPYSYTYQDMIYKSPKFPLGVEALLSLLDDVDWRELKNENSLLNRYLFDVFGVLCVFHHPRIKEFGKRLRNENMPFDLWQQGFNILLKYYTPDDRETVIACLTDFLDEKNDIHQFGTALGRFLIEAKKGISDMPLDIILPMWEKISDDNIRKSAVEVLLQYRILPDSIREECRYDRNPNIRELINQEVI